MKSLVLFVIFSTFVVGFAYLAYEKSDREYKKLNYSKTVYTDESAIVCPISLLVDRRADHDYGAIMDAFMSISARDEKVSALGCEQWRGGIRVLAHRMAPPFETFVAINPTMGGPAYLFTMEPHLTNSGVGVGVPASESQPQPLKPETKDSPTDAGATDEPVQGSTVDAIPNDAELYEADRADFQRKLLTLTMPALNLRWYTLAAKVPSRPTETLSLISPYGPCAFITGSRQVGYGVRAVDINPYRVPVVSVELGAFSSIDDARATAVEHCKTWYTGLRHQTLDGDREEHIWFTPDGEINP